MLGVVLGKLCLHMCEYYLQFGDVGCTGNCGPISWVEVLEVLRMLHAQVFVYISIGLKCWKFSCWKSCATHRMLYHLSDKLATKVLVCLPIGWVEVLEVLRMLDAQVLVYLSIGLKCWKFCASWPHMYLWFCQLVGLKCWKFCECWMRRYLCTYRLGLKCWKFCA